MNELMGIDEWAIALSILSDPLYVVRYTVERERERLFWLYISDIILL